MQNEGIIAEVQPGWMLIATQPDPMKVAVTTSTEVWLDDQPSTIAALAKGQLAWWETDPATNHATKIKLRSPTAAA